MFYDNHSADVIAHAVALRTAKQCREVIQSCLREEEWRDADFEFYRIIRANLEEFAEGMARKRLDALVATIEASR